MITRDRGMFRILIEGNDDPQNRNQYFQVDYMKGNGDWATYSEIVFVRDSRIAYNNALRKHGEKLMNIYNLETGRMVVGASY